MAHPPFEQAIGTLLRKRIALLDEDRDPAPFLPTDPISAVCWAGEGRAPLFEPLVEWLDAPAGLLRLTITPAMSEQAEAGQYRLRVFCTPPSDAHRRLVFDGSVRFLPSPGTGEAEPSYASFEDLLDECPHLQRLVVEDSDQAGFAEQRGEARRWFDEALVRHYHAVPGRTRRFVNLAGDGPGPYMQFAEPPDGALVPSDDDLRAMLDAGGLVISEPVKKAVCHKAASLVYRKSASGSYRDEAAFHEGQARQFWWNAVVEVKSDPDLDEPDLRIGRDVTFLT